jgi:hypothetical protein
MRHGASIQSLALGALAALGCHNPSASEPGVLEVAVAVTGLPTDTATHGVIVTLAGVGDLARQAIRYGGGTVAISGLPPGTHRVRLESPSSTCLVANAYLRATTIPAGDTTRVRFTVSCFGPPAVVFNRVSRDPLPSVERYILGSDGTVLAQVWGKNGLSDLRGVYAKEGDLFRFAFASDIQATGTPLGECLTIETNLELTLDTPVNRAGYCPGPREGALAGQIASAGAVQPGR